MSKNFLIKLISVMLVAFFVLGIAPIGEFSKMLINASAAVIPEYNSNYGEFIQNTVNGNTVLTAKPYVGCSFRGWYDKNGNEVAYTKDFTLPKGKLAEDYIPVFYNLSLIKNGGFEEYQVNTNMKTLTDGEQWDGYPDAEPLGKADWTTMTVSNNRARTGVNSLKIQSQANTAYRTFTGLEKNTQYTLNFYYNFDASTADTKHYLSRIFVLPGDEVIPLAKEISNAKYLAHKNYTNVTGATADGEWKEVSLTFYSNENTTVKFLLVYGSPSAAMYIDDMSLTKDSLAVPNYVNDDFSSGIKNVYLSDTDNLSVSGTGYRVGITSNNVYKFVQLLNPFKVKKNCSYTVKFNLDLSEINDSYVPKTEGGKMVTDSEGNIVYDTSAPNWIHIDFSDTEKAYGSGNYYYDNIADSNDKSYVATITDAKGKSVKVGYRNFSNIGFGRKNLTSSGLDTSSAVTVTIPFIAHRNAEVYFNVRLNGLGTYYIDNLTITENQSDLNKNEFISNEAINTLGTAIRINGKQGMRHKTQIEKELLSSDMYYGIRLIEYGTVAIKTEYLKGNALVVDGVYTYDGQNHIAKKGVSYSFKDNIDKIYLNSARMLDFTGVLINIAPENWNEDYTVRAYFKYVDVSGKEGVLYANPFDVSVYPLAKEAYSAKNSAGEYLEGKDVREKLYTRILSKFTDKIIKVSETSDPIYTNFQGIRSTVYHATTFFQNNHGRTYTEAQAATEMDRLVDSKVDNVRTRFASQWMWTSNGWDWESAKMQAIYKWAKMLQDRDISITLNASWHLHDFVYYYDYNKNNNLNAYSQNGHSSIPEVNYLHGEGTALYGEDAFAADIEASARVLGLNLTDSELEHYSVAAARYGEWIKQALAEFRAHGINNVEFILPFTETGYSKTGDTTYCYDEWIIMVMGLHDTLKSAGARGNYKLIGPSQNIYKGQSRLSLMEYMYNNVINGTDYEDMLDINAMHQYAKPNVNLGYETDYDNTIYDPAASYSFCQTNFPYFRKIVETTGNSNKEFWCDEYFAFADDIEYIDGNGMQMVQFAAGLTSGINNGVNRFLSWQMFDCLWDSTATHTQKEFLGGVHICGTCPSLIKVDGKVCTIANCPCNKYNLSSYTPRNTYYGINLIGKYMNNKSSDVYKTEIINDAVNSNDGLYVAAINNDDGNTVILVVNTMPTVTNVEIQLEKNTTTALKRYCYDPDEVVCTPEAKSIESDKIFILNSNKALKDTVPSRSFAIYVAEPNGLDNEMDMGILG